MSKVAFVLVVLIGVPAIAADMPKFNVYNDGVMPITVWIRPTGTTRWREKSLEPKTQFTFVLKAGRRYDLALRRVGSDGTSVTDYRATGVDLSGIGSLSPGVTSESSIAFEPWGDWTKAGNNWAPSATDPDPRARSFTVKGIGRTLYLTFPQGCIQFAVDQPPIKPREPIEPKAQASN